jgi:hypothetical protein
MTGQTTPALPQCPGWTAPWREQRDIAQAPDAPVASTRATSMTPQRVPGTLHSWEVECVRCDGVRYLHEKVTDPIPAFAVEPCCAAVTSSTLRRPTPGESLSRRHEERNLQACAPRSASGKGVSTGDYLNRGHNARTRPTPARPGSA